jgi:excisionase family DNA binding protein
MSRQRPARNSSKTSSQRTPVDTDEFDDLMLVEEVADFVRKVPKTVLNWIHDEELPAIKLNGCYLIQRRDLHAYLRARRAR